MVAPEPVRSYYSNDLQAFIEDDNGRILSELTRNHQFALEELQRNAWIKQIEILKDELEDFDSGHILFEYSIPRMGKRVDIIFIYSGFVFVIEFKVNATKYHSGDLDQCLDYALDLKNFQEQSHEITLVPILVATNAPDFNNELKQDEDRIIHPLRCNSNNLKNAIQGICENFEGDEINPNVWENSLYKPTPTIIEAAQALYQGHDVKEISRSDSGAENLVKTADAINQIIEKSKAGNLKSICFITGVPGAGKTLAGLNLANERHKFDEEEHAVFLSGNGPLVMVLQEALARNEKENSPTPITKEEALRKAKAFIQNIHFFRDEALQDQNPPFEKVVIFDEAQRAWDEHQTSSFMQRKRGDTEFSQSEPEFLISVMDRRDDWAVIICLIGGGQEINTGEAGLQEWFSALKNHYANWQVYLSNEISDIEYTQGNSFDEMLSGINFQTISDLHLRTSIRSFRSEHVSKFVKALLDCDKDDARELYSELRGKYPIVITRNINTAKQWLRDHARGNERFGMVASSKAYRLKPSGIYVDCEIDAKNWFLNSKEDVRSSYYLEYVATEFDIQGLELDWICIGWDGDLRCVDDDWSYNQFRGTNWNGINSEAKKGYLKNTYRVLLTRARQGVVIFIPEGDDNDDTRRPEYYDGTYNYLREIGIDEI